LQHAGHQPGSTTASVENITQKLSFDENSSDLLPLIDA
jgi:hypothetical protein